MTGVAIGSLLMVYLVVPWLQKARPWRVTSVVRLTPKQWEVTVTPNGHRGLDYRAGQFAWLNVGQSPFSMKEHPFSISIDGALMDRVFSEQEFRDWVFVMCGPAVMMDVVEDHLIRRGTPAHRILSERFSYD